MFCKKCEKELPEGSTFCPYCGSEELGTEKVAESAPKKDSGKGIIIGVLSFFVVVLAVLVALLAAKFIGGTETPAVTDAPTVTDGVGTTATEGELFDSQYQTVYPNGFNYLSVNVDDYVTLGQYKGLTVTVTTSSEITDADVDEYVASQLDAHSTLRDVTDRVTKDGDTVNIDYVGTIDGVAFDGGTASGTETVLGSGGFIPGFEEGIYGMSIGETKTVDATFPESYGVAELAGKTAQFAITLNSVKETVVPEYNDAFVRDNFDIDTIPQFEAYVRALLAEEREAEILGEKQLGILTQIVDGSTVIKYPENVVEDYMFQQIDSARFYGAMYYGMEYSEFIPAALGISAYEYEQQVRESSEAAVKQELVLFATYKAAGLEITDADREKALEAFLVEYEAEDVETLCGTLGVTEEYLENTIAFTVVFEKTMEYLVENTTFVGAN